jgi:hypothetical protein
MSGVLEGTVRRVFDWLFGGQFLDSFNDYTTVGF